MKFFSIFMISFGLIIMFFPEVIAYLLGAFFIFIGINVMLLSVLKPKGGNSDYVKFGNYKIYRNK